MSSRRDTDTTAPRGWITVGLFVVLVLGVLGMHGLAAHGVPGAGHHGGAQAAALPHAEPQAPPTALASATHADDTTTAGCQCDAGPTTTALSSAVRVDGAGESTGGHGAGLLELCLAVLTGIVLVLLLTAAIVRAPLGRLRRASTQAVRVLRARAPDPPSLHQLSLLRC